MLAQITVDSFVNGGDSITRFEVAVASLEHCLKVLGMSGAFLTGFNSIDESSVAGFRIDW